jgi:predicted ATPase
MDGAKLDEIRILGYRCFGDFRAQLGSLEVIVGANGSGKTSLFEFLRFLRDSVNAEVPPEIVPGSVGREIFHRPGPDEIVWKLTISPKRRSEQAQYRGGINGPLGRVAIFKEQLSVGPGPTYSVVFDRSVGSPAMKRFVGLSPTRFALGWHVNEPPAVLVLVFLNHMRFYDSYGIASAKVRRPAVIEQTPQLKEDCSNLSAVLFYLQTEHRDIFEGITRTLGLVIPGFGRLNVQARGGPGEVLAFAKIGDADLTVADLSDGQLRLLCWTTLCHLPDPGSLICIDEPDVGLHPRVLPLLAGMFKRASEQTQILLATHNSFFLRQFGLEDIAVMRLEGGQPKFIKPGDSAVLRASLEDFGNDEIERLHQTEELEQLP